MKERRDDDELQRRMRRHLLILYLVMTLFIALPFIILLA